MDQQQGPVISLDQFLRQSNPIVTPVAALQAWTDGGTVNYNLPQAGLLTQMMVNIDFAFTVAGTITGGTFQPDAPWTLIRNLNFKNQQGFNLHNYSGVSWYDWTRARNAVDIFKATANGYFNSNDAERTLGIGNSLNPVVPGANVTAGNYVIRWTLPIPIAYNSKISAGAINLQNSARQYVLALQFGALKSGIGGNGGTNDIFNALLGVSNDIAVTVTKSNISVTCETMQVLETVEPDLSIAMTVQESLFSLTNGQNTVIPAYQDAFSLMILTLTNNGARLPYANISQEEFVYASNQRRYVEDIATKGGWNYWQHRGVPPQNGQIFYDLRLRGGVIGDPDIYDVFNNAIVTGFSLRFNNSAAVTGVSGVRLLTEGFAAVVQ